MQAIIYSIVFVIFLGISFYVLRAMRLERLFQQGHVFEIRAAYLIFSIIMAFLVSEFIFRLLSCADISW